MPLSEWRSNPQHFPRQVLLHPYTLFFLVTLLVFLPDGFNIGPVNDGWIKLGSYLHGSPVYNASITRAFGGMPRDIGMLLGNGGFQGWQAFLFLFTLLRGVLFYEIVRRLFPAARPFAVACGLVALFHPADGVYFWVDVTGVHMALVTALAACLAALIYQQRGSRAALLAMLLFQLFTCLTYSGFLLLMLAFPAGLWLLRWAESGSLDWRYLLRTCWLPAAYLVLQVVLVKIHFGHEGQVAVLRPHRVLASYGEETLLFFRRSLEYLRHVPLRELPWTLPAAALALFCASRRDAAPPVQRGARFYLVLCLGLLALAAACYLPYAVSQVAVGARRQLFATGIFLYMLLLMPLFLWLPRQVPFRHLPALLVAVIALLATWVGLENRNYWVNTYRHEEKLLAAVAAAAPHPAPGAVIVIHLQQPSQAMRLAGFYNRRAALRFALKLMYGDKGVEAAFAMVNGPMFSFGPDRLEVRQGRRMNAGNSSVPYRGLVLLDYPLHGKPQVLGRGWLQKYAPAGTDLSAYDPQPLLGAAPAADSTVCAFLEKAMRPKYCRR